MIFFSNVAGSALDLKVSQHVVSVESSPLLYHSNKFVIY